MFAIRVTFLIKSSRNVFLYIKEWLEGNMNLLAKLDI